MKKLKLFYATNRNHLGDNRWRPDSYGKKFSDDGIENLRFGRISVEASDRKLKTFLSSQEGPDSGDGEGLSGYLSAKVAKGEIRAYREKLDRTISDTSQPDTHLGSLGFFEDLRAEMKKNTDVLIYIHGFNVSWDEAVGAALALQLMLNRKNTRQGKKVLVILFSWPSDGMMMPFASYKSDRTEARGSGYAVGRAMLKVRDYLASLRDRARCDEDLLCEQDIHLLCHSMGNYVLQAALERLREMHTGLGLPKLFRHVFMCSPDVDEDVLEAGKAMHDLHRLGSQVNVYHNRGDVAMHISDYTKGNPERLGKEGTAHPPLLHHKIYQVDCSEIVSGIVEHSYYLWGRVNTDIRQSIDGLAQQADERSRVLKGELPNVFMMK